MPTQANSLDRLVVDTQDTPSRARWTPRALGRAATLLIAVCPALFVFFVIQTNAVTFPFWDHWEQARFIITYHDHGFAAAVWEVLGSLSQHTRPVTVRLIFLVNAILTDWDIRSEYIYLYIVFAATLFLHHTLIDTLDGRRRSLASGLVLSIVSIVYFSPANHNNHWWSWMLQLDLNNLIALSAFAVLSLGPRSLTRNVIAAALCWLSIYTLTNGLFLILIIAALSQLASSRPWRPSALTGFWLANIVAVYLTYFPIQEPGTSARPHLWDVLVFALAYLGNPIASLIAFPYLNLFEPPVGIGLAVACGVLLLAVFAALIAVRWRLFSKPPAHFLLLVGCGGYAILCAFATGWARVGFDSYGTRNGSSSRYVITGSYLLFSTLYFLLVEREGIARALLQRFPRRSLLTVAATVYLVFLGTSLNTYARSWAWYGQARQHNELIANGFRSDGSDTAVDKFLFPNHDQLRAWRNDLLRLRLGPYKHLPTTVLSLGDERMLSAIHLSPGVHVSQTFTLPAGRLVGIRFPVVTWGKSPSTYGLHFRLSEVSSAGSSVLEERTIRTDDLHDWKMVVMSRLARSGTTGARFLAEFTVPEQQPIEAPVGLVIVTPTHPGAEPATTGHHVSAGGVLWMSAVYVQ